MALDLFLRQMDVNLVTSALKYVLVMKLNVQIIMVALNRFLNQVRIGVQFSKYGRGMPTTRKYDLMGHPEVWLQRFLYIAWKEKRCMACYISGRIPTSLLKTRLFLARIGKDCFQGRVHDTLLLPPVIAWIKSKRRLGRVCLLQNHVMLQV